MILSPNKFPAIVKPIENKNIKQKKDLPANEDTPTQGRGFPCLTPFKPLDKWELKWKKNYFAASQNIYELRGDKFTCKECGALFPSRLSILTHSKIHLKPFCVLCMEYTTTKSEMEFHMYHDHKEYTYYRNTLSLGAGGPDVRNTIAARRYLYETNKLKKIFLSSKNRLKKASLVQPVKQQHSPERVTKVVTSRFGRCITVKLPDF